MCYRTDDPSDYGASRTCEATISHRFRSDGWGFEPRRCGQQVGLAPIEDTSGVTRYACARDGHRASVVRQFGDAAMDRMTCDADDHVRGCPCVAGGDAVLVTA